MAEVMRGPQARPRPTTTTTAVLKWHIIVFVVVNLVLWVVDVFNGGGIGTALWISIPWSFALGAHVIAYRSGNGEANELSAHDVSSDERRRETEIR
ncbi:MAG: hypothetical protein HKO03_06340 [Acidimicrobiia bacterium]|nr:hypothetical protein [Acidimicrobiia bacterium]NNF65654.1 hypothetical protein [Acidimicrobiia bacterium]